MEELTRLRQARGWTQSKLAEASGVDKATLNQAERGRRSPKVETLEKLAEALGVEVADFFPRAQPGLFAGAGTAMARPESLDQHDADRDLSPSRATVDMQELRRLGRRYGIPDEEIEELMVS